MAIIITVVAVILPGIIAAIDATIAIIVITDAAVKTHVKMCVKQLAKLYVTL